MTAGGAHQAHDRAVVDLQAVRVGQIKLEGRDPHLDTGRDDRLWHGLGECEVEAPVDDRRLGPRAPRGDSRHRIVPPSNGHVVDYGRGAADRSSARPAHEIVRHPNGAHGHV